MLGHCFRDLGELKDALNYFSDFGQSPKKTGFLLESYFYQMVCQHEMNLDDKDCMDSFTSEIENIDEYVIQSQDHQHLVFMLKHAAVYFNLLDKPVEFISVAKSLLKLYITIPTVKASSKGKYL